MIERYLSREELLRLTAAFASVSIGLCLFVALWLIVVPGIRSGTRPEATASEAVYPLATGWLDPAEYPAAKGYVIAPVKPEEVLSASPKMLDRGKALYEANCLPCHGDGGAGNGPSAGGLSPAPRDFTGDKGWKNGYGLAGVFKTLNEGLSGSAMAPFAYLRVSDRMALAHYVRSLAKFKRNAEDPSSLQALGKLLATTRQVVPPQIPVSKAMAKLEAEYRAPEPLRLTSELMRRAVRDPERAAEFLRGVPGWRRDAGALAKAAAAGAPANGFDVRVAEFSLAEWGRLRRGLIEAQGTKEKTGP